jgi:CheY-like chemotaxis protein
VHLEVTDTGCGIDAGTRERIFEPFFTTKPPGQGTGLGLANVFAVVRRLGGQVMLDSEPGQGSRFTLCFPVHQGGDPAAADRSVPMPPGQGTVLVEDDGLVRDGVEAQLRKLGYRPLLAGSAEEAVQQLCQHPGAVDVLLTDVMMPGRLGGELASDLCRQHPDLEVLYMSAHPASEHIAHGRLPEGARCLQKPFDARALGTSLAAALETRWGR